VFCARVCARLDPADVGVRIRGYVYEYVGFSDAVEDHVGYWAGDGGEFGEGEVVRWELVGGSCEEGCVLGRELYVVLKRVECKTRWGSEDNSVVIHLL
jgi:hypothetical protein